MLSWWKYIMRSACLWTECALSPQWSSQHVASQWFLAALWGSRTRSPRFGHDSGAHRNSAYLKRIARILDSCIRMLLFVDVVTHFLHWDWVPLTYTKMKHRIFSAQTWNSIDIDGRSSVKSLASVLRKTNQHIALQQISGKRWLSRDAEQC